MAGKRDFYDRPLYTITEYVASFAVTNLFFLLCNLPIMFYTIMVAIEPKAFSVLMLAVFMIPTGPAVTALCSSMSKLIKDKEAVTMYYFKVYKEKFFISLKMWCIGLVAVFIFIMDYRFFIDKGNLFGVVFFALAIYVLVIALYAFPIITRFNVGVKKLVRISFLYSIKKINITIIKIVLLILGSVITYKSPVFNILGIFSLICYVVMYYDRGMITELEEAGL